MIVLFNEAENGHLSYALVDVTT